MIVVGTTEELKMGKGETALTITQAAARLGVSEITVRKYVANARLTPYDERMNGKQMLFPSSEVERLKNEMTRDAY